MEADQSDQQVWTTVDVEAISRCPQGSAIWELAGRLDLSGSPEQVRRCGEKRASGLGTTVDGSLWVYAYSEGISSAREIERMMDYEPGFGWLSGLQVVNHHTLSIFRMEHKAELDELFAAVAGMLERKPVIAGTGDA